MSGITLSLGFDPASMARIKGIEAFNLTLQRRLRDAMAWSIDDLEQEATAYMWSEFQNPQGPLEDAFEQNVYGPYKAELVNPSPYAYRRNYGFTGQTDSLGRFYRYDWGIGFMEYALKEQLSTIQENFQVAIDLAFIDVGAL